MNLKIICAYLSLLGGIIIGCLDTFILFTGKTDSGPELIIALFFLIYSYSTIYVFFSHKLYKFNEADTLEAQNKFLKLQIEQKSLKDKLKQD